MHALLLVVIQMTTFPFPLPPEVYIMYMRRTTALGNCRDYHGVIWQPSLCTPITTDNVTPSFQCYGRDHALNLFTTVWNVSEFAVNKSFGDRETYLKTPV